MENLQVALVQTELFWEDASQNHKAFAKHLASLQGRADVVVLPEMFSTGFTMNASTLAEPEDGPTLNWMKEQSKLLDAALTGSVIVESGGAFYNRLYWVTPDGHVVHYDKRHLFRMAGEDKIFSSGAEKKVVQWKGWRICPLICYDLRFPVWSRSQQDYDLLIYVANWPEARREAWKILGQARAIENLSPVVAVNRVGKDGNGISYAGDSAVYDAKGVLRSTLKPNEVGAEVVTLNGEELVRFREKFPAHRDADQFSIEE